MAGQVVEVSEATFEAEVVQAGVPVVVDFWAPWCGPCRMIAPVLDELGKRYDGKVRIAKVNVDQNQGLAQKFRVTGIPLIIAFKGGKEVNRVVGANAKAIEEMNTGLVR